jgi:ribosomal protein L32
MAKAKRKTHQQASGITIPTKCQQCGSTRRSKYSNSQVLGPGRTWRNLSNIPAGTPYVSLTKSRCVCLKCGQARVDQRFEFDESTLSALRTPKSSQTAKND